MGCCPADRGLRKPVQCGGDEEFIVDGRKPGFLWAPIRVAVCCCGCRRIWGCKMQYRLKTKLVFQDNAVYLNQPTGIEWEGGLRVLSAWQMDCWTCSRFLSRVSIPAPAYRDSSLTTPIFMIHQLAQHLRRTPFPILQSPESVPQGPGGTPCMAGHTVLCRNRVQRHVHPQLRKRSGIRLGLGTNNWSRGVSSDDRNGVGDTINITYGLLTTRRRI